MSNSTGSTPLGPLTDAVPTPQVASLCVRIWLHPSAVLEDLLWAPGWAWLVPMGCALALFYAKLFTLAFLKAPVMWWALLSGVLGIVIGWPLRAWLLARISALLGGHCPFTVSLTLCTWAAWPLLLRDVVQVIYMLGTGNWVAYPGLSGLLVDMAATHWLLRIGQLLLGWLDLFTFWQLGLLVVAVRIGAHVATRTAVAIVALYYGLVLILGTIVILL